MKNSNFACKLKNTNSILHWGFLRSHGRPTNKLKISLKETFFSGNDVVVQENFQSRRNSKENFGGRKTNSGPGWTTARRTSFSNEIYPHDLTFLRVWHRHLRMCGDCWQHFARLRCTALHLLMNRARLSYKVNLRVILG